MTEYKRQKLSKIANQWFSLFQRQTEEIIVVYEATVSTNTKKTSKLSWQYLQIQFYYFFSTWSYCYTAKNDRNLSLFVYNMQLYIQRLSRLIVWSFSNFSHMVPNEPERSQRTIFMEKANQSCHVFNKIAYRNLAAHITLNPIGRSFPWQLRRLN